MMREGITERRASMSKTMKGKSHRAYTRLGEEIEGGRRSEAGAM